MWAEEVDCMFMFGQPKNYRPVCELLASDVGEFGDKAVEGRHGDGKPVFCCSTNSGAK
jgi:hypothetical protein